MSKHKTTYLAVPFKLLMVLPILLICIYTALFRKSSLVRIEINDLRFFFICFNQQHELTNFHVNSPHKVILLKSMVSSFSTFLNAGQIGQVSAKVIESSTAEKFLIRSGFQRVENFEKYIVTINVIPKLPFSFFSKKRIQFFGLSKNMRLLQYTYHAK